MISNSAATSSTELSDVAKLCDISMTEAEEFEETGVIKKERDGRYDYLACAKAILAHIQEEITLLTEIQKSMR